MTFRKITLDSIEPLYAVTAALQRGLNLHLFKDAQDLMPNGVEMTPSRATNS